MPSDALLASTVHAPSLRRMANNIAVLSNVTIRVYMLNATARNITPETTRNGPTEESMHASPNPNMLAALSVRAGYCYKGKSIFYLRRVSETNIHKL